MTKFRTFPKSSKSSEMLLMMVEGPKQVDSKISSRECPKLIQQFPTMT